MLFTDSYVLLLYGGRFACDVMALTTKSDYAERGVRLITSLLSSSCGNIYRAITLYYVEHKRAVLNRKHAEAFWKKNHYLVFPAVILLYLYTFLLISSGIDRLYAEYYLALRQNEQTINWWLLECVKLAWDSQLEISILPNHNRYFTILYY